ncbi:MAG: hypothetical protein ABIL58_28425 [Pseudomonadota bacterium]
MRKMIFILLVFFLAASAHAGAVLTAFDLETLSVVATDKAAGTAVVMDRSGATATVTVGDAIGSERAEVVKITRAYIKVKAGNLLTRMPLSDSAATPGGKALSAPTE